MRPGLESEPVTCDTIRVSSGSAAVLGLRPLAMETAPTTAYLMIGDGCDRNCAFCTQARGSESGQSLLSRVNWPEFPLSDVVEAIARAHADRRIDRACFQVTVSPGYLECARSAVDRLAAATDVPICTSVVARSLEDVEGLLAAGAERVTLALDAASAPIYRHVKGGSWERGWALLENAACRFPHRIGTHLIVGLGETEREMVSLLARLLSIDVAVALFAFTPVRGTAMADEPSPDISHYRRMQAALWLLNKGLAKADDFAYNADGRAIGLGLSPAALMEALAGGAAFRTSGCLGCNRPYYNERPGGVMYNYPRPLTTAESRQEIADLVKSLGPDRMP